LATDEASALKSDRENDDACPFCSPYRLPRWNPPASRTLPITQTGAAMPSAKELEELFWKDLKSDMTVMLGAEGVEDGHLRPMTAQAEGDHGPIFMFTSKDTALGGIKGSHKAQLAFASKNHELFATVHGKLSIDNDRETIERLWSPFVEAWFEQGKDDPKIALLRFEPETAEIWQNESSILAGAKTLFGSDPKADYKDKVAKVAMR
jgi:general stress protein 26